jgi:hypothetical protein
MSRKLEVPIRLNGPQYEAHGVIFGPDGSVNRRRTLFTGWGRGVGKTHFARTCWWTLVAAFDFKVRAEAEQAFRGVRINSLCPTLKQWKQINAAGIEGELGPGGRWEFLRGKYDRQSGIVKFPGGSYVQPFPASEYNARTARGMRTDVLDAEELDDIDASVYDSVAVPWLSEPWSLGLEFLRGTPTRGRHGLWWRTSLVCKLAERLRRGEISEEEALALPQAVAILEVFENLSEDDWPVGLPRDPAQAALEVMRGYYGSVATYKDSPETVSALSVARAKATTPPEAFRREWLSDPDAGEGLIYPFEERFHVVEPPLLERFREFHIGVDFGWVDAAVLLLAGVQGHGEDSTLWILDESYESGIPNHIWDQRAQAMHNACAPYGRATFWPDPSRPERAHDFRTMGLTVGQVDNDILAGVGRVAELMFIRKIDDSDERWSRLYISPKCRNLIAELGKYRRKKLPDGSFDEMPEDKWNHACDALRYLVMGRFGRPQNFRRTSAGR